MGFCMACISWVSDEIKSRKHIGSELARVSISEFLGTLFLIYAGCNSCITGLTHGDISPLQPALVFGFAVASIIQAFGHISGAHLNPAVTLAAVILKKLSWKLGLVYLFCQCCGALCGYGLVLLGTPKLVRGEDEGDHGFCMTIPHSALNIFQALLTEFMATGLLILVLCGCLDDRNKDKQDSAPLKFGFVIAGMALAAGHHTGASMNPARSFGPAFWNWNFESHWIYWVAPLSSAACVALLYRFILTDPPEQPRTSVEQEVPLQTISPRGPTRSYD